MIRHQRDRLQVVELRFPQSALPLLQVAKVGAGGAMQRLQRQGSQITFFGAVGIAGRHAVVAIEVGLSWICMHRFNHA